MQAIVRFPSRTRIVVALAIFCVPVTLSAAKEATRAGVSSASPLVRSLTYEDLISIVDIGVPGEGGDDFRGVAVSPDHRTVAIETRRALLTQNRTEIRWVVVSLDAPNRAIDVGDGGEAVEIFTLQGLSVGYAAEQIPLWSADSEWIFYTARRNGETQIWRSRRDGTAQERLTHSTGDVKSFLLTDGGGKVFFETGPNRTLVQNVQNEEAARGYYFDGRFSPAYAKDILVDSSKPPYNESLIWQLETTTHNERKATEEERAWYATSTTPEKFRDLNDNTRPVGRRNGHVWLEDRRPNRAVGVNPPLTIVASADKNDINPIPCGAPACTGRHKGIWFDGKNRTVYFLRWSGRYNYGPMTLYSWRVGDAKVQQLFRTEDLLRGCILVDKALICGHESATTPMKLVRLNLRNKEIMTLFDANPAFGRIQMGGVETLNWKSADGIEGFGHLVRPVGYQSGHRYPLVIVQYRSRGFLRGGVGDEFPIHMFASKGFAVLSFHEPDDWDLEAESKSDKEAYFKGFDGLTHRRRVLSSLLSAIDLLDARGVIDSKRVGITGLSSGAENATFMLIHAPERISAAALSQTFWSPSMYYLLGPEFQRQFSEFGMDDPGTEAAAPKWKGLSIALNAEKIQAPLLLQVGDSELLPEMQAVTALDAYRKPVEMHVFPGESHIKLQPIHRYNVYRRSVQWFRFWLQDIEEPDPVDSAQYSRWQQLRSLN